MGVGLSVGCGSAGTREDCGGGSRDGVWNDERNGVSDGNDGDGMEVEVGRVDSEERCEETGREGARERDWLGKDELIGRDC